MFCQRKLFSPKVGQNGPKNVNFDSFYDEFVINFVINKWSKMKITSCRNFLTLLTYLNEILVHCLNWSGCMIQWSSLIPESVCRFFFGIFELLGFLYKKRKTELEKKAKKHKKIELSLGLHHFSISGNRILG